MMLSLDIAQMSNTWNSLLVPPRRGVATNTMAFWQETLVVFIPIEPSFVIFSTDRSMGFFSGTTTSLLMSRVTSAKTKPIEVDSHPDNVGTV